VSSTSRTILIGSLIGAAIGGAIAWAYQEFASDEEEEGADSMSGFRFQADAGDIMKVAIAAIPLVRMVTNLFVPVNDTTITLPKQDRS
jgi:hypothetical protein